MMKVHLEELVSCWSRLVPNTHLKAAGTVTFTSQTGNSILIVETISGTLNTKKVWV